MFLDLFLNFPKCMDKNVVSTIVYFLLYKQQDQTKT